jgi:kinesin family member 11
VYNATESFHSSAATHLSSAKQATQGIVEQGTREDRPTGSTPSKRAWKYVDRWDLAKPRDALLREWRQSGTSTAGDDTFTAEHLPLPDDEEDVDATAAEETRSPPPEEEVSPVLMSSVSSTSSASTIALPPVPVAKIIEQLPKSGIPIKGTLTERPTNVPTRSRRIR